MTAIDRATELDPGALWLACSASPAFFIDRCAQLYDPTGATGGGLSRGWQPFRLWPSQVAALETLAANRLCVVLKARQLGMSSLTVAFALWHMLFRPTATVLLFSKRDDEAVHLLNVRLRDMYDRLPRPLQAAAVTRDNAHEFRLSNGSAALAFPTTGGRSYTASIAIVDEADHVGGAAAGDDLDTLLNAVKPTIDGGGRLILLSTADKARPESAFKRTARPSGARTALRPSSSRSRRGRGGRPHGTRSRCATCAPAPAGWTTCIRSIQRPWPRRWPRARWTSDSAPSSSRSAISRMCERVGRAQRGSLSWCWWSAITTAMRCCCGCANLRRWPRSAGWIASRDG